MALGAGYYMVWCALDGEPDMAKGLLQVLVPAGTPGVETDGKWNTLGMRATFSPSVKLNSCIVGADAALGQPGAATTVGVVESFGLGYAAIYLGIAEAALEFAMDYVKKRIVRPENIAVAQDPIVQRHIGELRTQLDAALLVLANSAASWENADMVERALLANKAKYLATEVGLQVTSRRFRWWAGAGPTRTTPWSARSGT
jgi:alkylation response protein AidB-like acyl-CoA dehydrogenase